MPVYVDLVIILNSAVDLLLLLGTNRLCGYRSDFLRCLLAACLGGGYAAMCLISGFSFLGATFWRILFLVLIAVSAFGFSRSTFRRSVVFLFLSMTLGGIAVGLGRGGVVSLILSAVVLAMLCYLGFREGVGRQSFVSVCLIHNGKSSCFTALQDTGNTLKDPVSGCQVIVADPGLAWDILGLTPAQLRDPISAMNLGHIKGMRLIPYRAVGQPGGMLLGFRPHELTVNGKKEDFVVAFAPTEFAKGKQYRALTGGVV